MKKQGVLIYDDVIGRMDIRFGPLDHYTGIPRDEVRKAILAQMGVPENASLPRQKILPKADVISALTGPTVLAVPGVNKSTFTIIEALFVK